LIDKKTSVERARRHEGQIPNCPPDGTLAQAVRTDARVAIVELVGTHRLATKHSLRESPYTFDRSIAHGQPLFPVETQCVSDGLPMLLAIEVSSVP